MDYAKINQSREAAQKAIDRQLLPLFKDLTDAEILEFQQWARDNYTPLTPIDGTWHWVVQLECVAINRKAAL